MDKLDARLTARQNWSGKIEIWRRFRRHFKISNRLTIFVRLCANIGYRPNSVKTNILRNKWCMGCNNWKEMSLKRIEQKCKVKWSTSALMILIRSNVETFITLVRHYVYNGRWWIFYGFMETDVSVCFLSAWSNWTRLQHIIEISNDLLMNDDIPSGWANEMITIWCIKNIVNGPRACARCKMFRGDCDLVWLQIPSCETSKM